jgi:hypothetical protein
VSFLSAVLFVSDCLLIHITLNPIPHTRHGIQYLIHASLNPIPPTRARNQNRIPSLGGPASIASRTDGTGFKWLTDFSSGGPPLGWHDTIAYLILPVLLVVSQSASQKIMQPEQQNVDPSQQQTQAILKYLPLMIGFFSLNVPAGLTLYWFANNILSTAQTVYLRKTTKAPEAPAAIAVSISHLPHSAD